MFFPIVANWSRPSLPSPSLGFPFSPFLTQQVLPNRRRFLHRGLFAPPRRRNQRSVPLSLHSRPSVPPFPRFSLERFPLHSVARFFLTRRPILPRFSTRPTRFASTSSLSTSSSMFPQFLSFIEVIFFDIPTDFDVLRLLTVHLPRALIAEGFVLIWADYSTLPTLLDLFESKGFFYVENLSMIYPHAEDSPAVWETQRREE